MGTLYDKQRLEQQERELKEWGDRITQSLQNKYGHARDPLLDCLDSLISTLSLITEILKNENK